MNKAEKASRELAGAENLAHGDSFIHRMSPLSKLAVTVTYIAVTVSFGKYDFSALAVMALFPVIAYQLALIPVFTCFRKLRMILPLVCAVGLFNPFFDREILFTVGSLRISGGVVSMITLMMKGVFSLMASFLLAATTKIEDICASLRKLHIPRMLVSLLLLTFRYISVMLDEVSVMSCAYSLRSPGSRGVAVGAWGSFLGQLILRSSDRANELYESMVLRGFNGEFEYTRPQSGGAVSWLISAAVIALIFTARFFNLTEALGSLIGR